MSKGLPTEFDVITTFDVVHDAVDPLQLLQSIRRALRPGGVVLAGGKTFVKPAASGVDQWRHPYHGPDNNPQSRDRVARGPYLTQFLAEPYYAPLPQVAVASGGRVFKAFGHIAFKERGGPWLDTLCAFNGYNGTLLWRRETAQGRGSSSLADGPEPVGQSHSGHEPGGQADVILIEFFHGSRGIGLRTDRSRGHYQQDRQHRDELLHGFLRCDRT